MNGPLARLLAEIRELDETGLYEFGPLTVAVREWRKEGYPTPAVPAVRCGCAPMRQKLIASGAAEHHVACPLWEVK